MVMMMASPMTTSAAATTMTKNAMTWPSRFQVFGEGHERQIGRIEHELDAHEHDDGVAPNEDAGTTEKVGS